MDRQTFENLYLHAHAITELAFLRAIAAALAAPAPALSADELAANAAAAERMLKVTAEQFDWSAFAGVEGFGVPAGAGEPEPAALATDGTASADATLDGAPTFGDALGDIEEGPPDVARFVEQLQAARAVLQPRVAYCFARSAPAVLSEALARLPRDLPSLGTELSAADLTRWVELHEQRHAGLQALVAAILRLEPDS